MIGLGLAVGFIIGGIFGFFMCALMVAADDDNEGSSR